MTVASTHQPDNGRETCLELRGISKRFGSLHVLEDVDLTVRFGERRGIIGPNGAGKTTLFNIIAGELQPSAGRVRFFDRDITRMPPHARARHGLARTFQTTTLCPGLTVTENLVLSLQALTPTRFQAFVPRSRYGGFREEALRLLKQVELEHCADWLVRALGHGEQRQVEILMALAQRPKLLLLDEPTAGLAAADAALVTDMLRAYHREVAMVLIEHDLSVVFNVVERITVLHYGRVVAEETVASIHDNPVVQEIYLGGKL